VQLIAAVALLSISGIVTAALYQATRNSKDGGALERLVRIDAATRSGFVRLQAAIEDPADDLEQLALSNATTARFAVETPVKLSLEAISDKIDIAESPSEILVRYLEQEGLTHIQVSSLLSQLALDREKDDATAAMDHLAMVLAPSTTPSEHLTQFGSSGSAVNRFDIVVRVTWSPAEESGWRMPIEISAAGKPIPLAGPSL
jgi:hypothetical protein